jgi:hypothetical protein
MTDIGTAIVYIRPKIHKVDHNPVTRTFGDYGGNWCFVDSFGIRITDFAPVNDPCNVFKCDAVVPFKDTNMGLRDSYIKLAREPKGGKAHDFHVTT